VSATDEGARDPALDEARELGRELGREDGREDGRELGREDRHEGGHEATTRGDGADAAPADAAPAGARPARYLVPCTPPLFARGGHAQTVFASLLPCSAPTLVAGRRGYERVEVALDDGDRLVALARPGTSGVVVHVWHGLSGDANADYVRRAARVAEARGHGVWAVNHRGQGAGAGLARGTYHSGRQDDLAAVLRAAREREPDARHLIVGFSMSGNAGLLLAANDALAPPDGLVAINPPVDLAVCSDLIQRGFSRVYERRFVRRLRRELVRRERAGLLDVPVLVEPGMRLRDLDDLHTAPAGGFANADDYYARCSARPHLRSVRVPTVVVTAKDDPFVDAAAYDGVASPHLLVHLEESGGHVGYLARAGLGYRRWLDGALGHYLDELVRLVP